jgi:hypothetical protein
MKAADFIFVLSKPRGCLPEIRPCSEIIIRDLVREHRKVI